MTDPESPDNRIWKEFHEQIEEGMVKLDRVTAERLVGTGWNHQRERIVPRGASPSQPVRIEAHVFSRRIRRSSQPTQQLEEYRNSRCGVTIDPPEGIARMLVVGPVQGSDFAVLANVNQDLHQRDLTNPPERAAQAKLRAG